MKKAYKDKVLQNCYEKGFDSKMNGATISNCNFMLFNTPEKTKAWEQGRSDGDSQPPTKQ